MPPVRSFLRTGHQVRFSSVSDLTSGHTQDVPMKPLLSHNHNNGVLPESKLSNAKPTKTQQHGTSSNYMDLNEFFQKIDKSSDDMSSNPGDLDPDYPKPTVDLLASLLTLGKMIQNQKQLIQRQTKPNVAPGITPTQELNDMMDIETEISSSSRQDTFPNNSLDDLNNMYQEMDKEPSISSSNTSINSKRQVVPEDIKDMDYWNRRKRNNLAAKKSREERRKKELEVVETTKQLEKENSQLTLILKRLTSRNEWLESRLQDIRNRRRTDQSIESSSLSSSAEES